MIRDDSVFKYINYVGCDPDCVDRTVLECGDDYPVGTLPSELGYFDYDDPCEYEEWYGSDVPVEDGPCYGP